MAPRPLPGDEPPGEPEDLDSQWADIVARLGDLGDAGPSAPTAPGGAAPATGPAGPAGHEAPARPADGPTHAPRPEPTDPRGWAPDPDVEAAEDHFVPPDPGPVLGGDPLLTMAWVLVVAVPALLVVTIVAWPALPTWVLQAAGAAFVAAVGLLVWRMPHRRDPDDDDPGAVV